jgi:hypothetical protein
MNNEFTEDKSYKPTKKIENNPVRNPSNIKGPKDNLTNQNFKEVNFVVDDEEKQNKQNYSKLIYKSYKPTEASKEIDYTKEINIENKINLFKIFSNNLLK